ncbi:Conopeptide-Ac1 [Frankliniella fusca]|uniref:Conopeptide-Ac1 n=1 Tax=Frankliniella fusca TaxID=407009 RepID=A0AAE1L6I5_9NEOP|nr:Conopeptide-Ac1 [Frankliniella fusca]
MGSSGLSTDLDIKIYINNKQSGLGHALHGDDFLTDVRPLFSSKKEANQSLVSKREVKRSLFKTSQELIKSNKSSKRQPSLKGDPLSSHPEKDSKSTMQLRVNKKKSYFEHNFSDDEEDVFMSISDDDSTWKPDSNKSRNCNDLDQSSDSDCESPQASKIASKPRSAASLAPSVTQLENNSVHESDGDEDDDNYSNDNDQTPKPSGRNIKSERRRLRNTGQQYTTSSGKTVKARKCRTLPNCKPKWCKIKEIPEEERQKIFEEYWALGDFNKRAQYVSSRIIKNQVKTSKRRGEEPKKDRTCTLEYSLIYNQTRLTVSKGCFLATLDENDKFVRGLLERRSSTLQVADDARGKHPPANKLPEEVRQGVVSHIRKFPAYISHYSRRHTAQLYLGSHLNVAIMHNLYLEEGNPKVSYHTYLDIFKRLRPKLKFKNPQIDTCVTCDSFKNSVEAEGESTPKIGVRVITEYSDHTKITAIT